MKNIPPKFFAIAVFCITLALYIITLTPGLTFTDSGELAGVASTLGIAHPTGYPLFAILGFIWTKIFPGRDVYAMNVFAAICTAASAAVFFLALNIILNFLSQGKKKNSNPLHLRRTGTVESGTKAKNSSTPETHKTHEPKDSPTPKLIAFITALSYGFARTVWSQATAVEVYSLHLLLVSLTLYFFLRASAEKNFSFTKKNYLFAALFLGLSFTNHLTTIFLLPPVLFLYLRRPGEKFSFDSEKKKFFGILLLVALAMLCLWLYLPLRSAQHPEFNWGEVHRSWQKFWYHASGQQYRVMMGKDYGLNWEKFYSALPMEFAWAGIIFVFAGMYFLWRRSREIFVFALLLLVSCLAYSLGYSIHDIENYFITAFLAMFIFMAAGILFFTEKYPKILPAFFLLPIASIAINFSYNNRSQDYMVEEYTRILSEHLRPNAVIISQQWDNFVSAFWYKQRVEHYRPDVVVIEKELLRRTWYYDQLKKWYPEIYARSKKEIEAFLPELEKFESEKPYNGEIIQQLYLRMLNSFVDNNIDRRPVYLTAEIAAGQEDAVGVNYQRVPEGFAVRLEKDLNKNFPVSAKNIELKKFLLFEGKGEQEQFIRDNARNDLMNIANYALNRGMVADAKIALEKILLIEPENYLVKEQLEQLK